MKIDRIGLILVIGLISCSVASPTGAEEPIQPVFSQYMEELDVWKGQWDFFRSAKGELVLVGDGGPEGSGIASDDEGRTWHDWPDIHSWPEGGIQAITRRNDDLFIQGSDMRIWRSPDEGRTWLGGNRLLMCPNQVNKKLLWYTPGDRIVATKEGRLVVAVDFLLGGEGTGPEIIGSLVSEDNGETWRIYELFSPPPGYRNRPEGFGEPKPVELSDGRMWMVFRTCLGHLWQVFSQDGGQTWNEPSSTGLVAPAAPLHAQRVPDKDAVVVVFSNAKPTESMAWKENYNFWFPRGPMVFVVSHDHCKTWSRPVIVTETEGYMRNIFFSDKEMFINYLEGTSLKHWDPEFQYRPKLAIYDLKEVLALQSGK